MEQSISSPHSYKLHKDLLPIIESIRKDKKIMTNEDIIDKYAAFKEQCITLFEMILYNDSKETDTMIKQFVSILQKKEEGLVGVYDADVEAANTVSEKYLYGPGSNFTKPSEAEIAKTSKKLREKHDLEHSKPINH